jgi:PAS domain-containing protein/CheY-like chemotaxis protein
LTEENPDPALQVSIRSAVRYGNPACLATVAPAKYVNIFASDITARRRAAEVLRVKDSAIASSLNAVAMADLQGRLTYVNPAFLRLWGYDGEDEVLGRSVLDFWEERDRAASGASGAETMWIRGVLADIEQRKQTEEALRTSEQRYRKLFEANLAGAYLTKLDGTILDFNDAMMRMLGYDSREERFAHRSSDFYADPRFRDELIRLLRETAGFGLLSIRERIELLGGRMMIRSAPGKGSTFLVVVPDNPIVGVDPRAYPTPGGHGGPPLRVLLADDHEVVRQGLASLLSEEEGVEIVGEATNGRDAVALADQLHPDVVVMDVLMPVMNGDEATRRIKENRPETRIVSLSMREEPEVREKMQEGGGNLRAQDRRIQGATRCHPGSEHARELSGPTG